MGNRRLRRTKRTALDFARRRRLGNHHRDRQPRAGHAENPVQGGGEAMNFRPIVFTQRCAVGMLAALLLFAPWASAQQQIDAKVKIAFNRFYNYDEITAMLHELVAAHPDLLSIQSIGQSVQGREMWLVTLNNPATGPDTSKPA